MTRASIELSPGDKALLEMLCHGKVDREIANAFGWHRESVTRKVGQVMDKMGAMTRCEAVAMYVERHHKTQGIIPKE